MNHILPRLTAALGAATLSVALVSSCGSKEPARSVRPELAKPFGPAPAQRIAQLDFGREAWFAQCAPAIACPTATPKTFATGMQPNAAVVDASASLDTGEEIVASAPERVLPEPIPLAKSMRIPRMVTVHFAPGDSSLSATARAQLDHVPGDAPADHGYTISGRTDNLGSRAANESLALKRATTFRDYLCARHPNLASHVEIDAQGSCCFAASNNSPDGRALNRRVDIVFHADGESAGSTPSATDVRDRPDP